MSVAATASPRMGSSPRRSSSRVASPAKRSPGRSPTRSPARSPVRSAASSPKRGSASAQNLLAAREISHALKNASRPYSKTRLSGRFNLCNKDDMSEYESYLAAGETAEEGFAEKHQLEKTRDYRRFQRAQENPKEFEQWCLENEQYDDVDEAGEAIYLSARDEKHKVKDFFKDEHKVKHRERALKASRSRYAWAVVFLIVLLLLAIGAVIYLLIKHPIVPFFQIKK